MNITKLNIFSQKQLSKKQNNSILNQNYFSNQIQNPNSSAKLKTLNQDTISLNNVNFGAKYDQETNEATFKLDELKEIFGQKALIKAKNKFNLPINLEDFDITVRKNPQSGKMIVEGDMNFVKYVNKHNCNFTSEDINHLLENVEIITGELVIGGFNDIYLPNLIKVNKLSARKCDNLNLNNLKSAGELDITDSSNVDLASLEYAVSIIMPRCKNMEFPNLESAEKIIAYDCKRVAFPKLTNARKTSLNFSENISMPALNRLSEGDLSESSNIDMSNLKRAHELYIYSSNDINISSLKEFKTLSIADSQNVKIPPKTKRARLYKEFISIMSMSLDD